jgi:acetoacetyl-CoA synthetase
MHEYMQVVNQKFDKSFTEYSELYEWSIENIPDFWESFWQYSGIVYSGDYSSVVDDVKKMPGARWFEGAKLNYAENLLKRRDDNTAIIFRGENEIERHISFKELYQEVHKVAEGLKRLGIGKSDRIAGFIPNMPEAIIAMLAASSLGAVWTSCSPDFGIKGVLDRFSQIEPKVIFAADGYYYKGKKFDSQEKLKGILHELPTVEKIVLIDYIQDRKVDDIPDAILWEDLAQEVEGEMTFEPLPFDHPLFIMYSSGTAGLPKSIVHSLGGTLIQHLKELMLHTDLRQDDVIF